MRDMLALMISLSRLKKTARLELMSSARFVICCCCEAYHLIGDPINA